MDSNESKKEVFFSKFNTTTFRRSVLDKNIFFFFKDKIGLGIIISFSILIESGFEFVITEKPDIIGIHFKLIYTITQDLIRINGIDKVTNSMKLVNLDNQYWIETILVIIPIIIRLLGFYMLKKAPSFYEDKNMTNLYQTLGIIFIFTGIFLIFTIFGFKLHEEFGNYDIFF